MAALEQGSPPTDPPDSPPQDQPPAPTAALPRRDFRDLTKRALTAAVLLGIALAAVWAGGLVFTMLVFAALALLLWEWADMALPFPDRTDKIVGTIGMTALLAAALLFMLPGILGLGALPNAPLWVFGLGVATAWAASFRLRWPRTLTPDSEQVHASIGDLLNYYKWATWFAPAIVAVPLATPRPRCGTGDLAVHRDLGDGHRRLYRWPRGGRAKAGTRNQPWKNLERRCRRVSNCDRCRRSGRHSARRPRHHANRLDRPVAGCDRHDWRFGAVCL